MTTPMQIEVIAPIGFPHVQAGDDLGVSIAETFASNRIVPANGDIIVLAQKIVSKAEGRAVLLRDVVASAEAVRLAAICHKDPRIVELILSESNEVMRCKPGVIIVRHRLGWVLANAGIDHSNIEQDDIDQCVLLLPKDPDVSAEQLRNALITAFNVTIAVMIIDSFGRAWRLGTCGTCIGAAGLATVHDLRGQRDLMGSVLQSSILGFGDEVAAAASLMMGQGAEGRPLAIVRGLAPTQAAGIGHDLIRPRHEDLFP